MEYKVIQLGSFNSATEKSANHLGSWRRKLRTEEHKPNSYAKCKAILKFATVKIFTNTTDSFIFLISSSYSKQSKSISRAGIFTSQINRSM